MRLIEFRNLPKVNPHRTTRGQHVDSSKNFNDSDYIPGVMVFIFRNGKIALFEFTESYAINTRESQLDRYDYSRIVEVSKSGNEFVVSILTVFDKLIKVVI